MQTITLRQFAEKIPYKDDFVLRISQEFEPYYAKNLYLVDSQNNRTDFDKATYLVVCSENENFVFPLNIEIQVESKGRIRFEYQEKLYQIRFYEYRDLLKNNA